MAPKATVAHLGVLERHILDTLRATPTQQATLGDLAQRATLPEGTVRMSLQWLLSCQRVQWDADRNLYRAT